LICRQATCCVGTTAALQAALAPGGPALIRLCPGTIYTGSFLIARDLTIVGSGPTSTILSGGHIQRVVQLQSGVIASLVELQITQGGLVTRGAGVSNEGSLTLTRCLVTDNEALANSGGIFCFGNEATLTLDSTAVTNNRAVDAGGGISNIGGNLLLRGATVISGNRTTNSGGRGGGIYSFGATADVILEGTTLISGNQAGLTNPTSGGGIYNDPDLPGHLLFLDAAQVVSNLPNDCTGPDCPS
jgi:hypothetical protein